MKAVATDGDGRTQKELQYKARRTAALSYKLAGLTYEQIADRLSTEGTVISEDGVRDLITRTLSRAENQGVGLLRELENARLDRAQAAIWPKVLEGDLGAVNTFLNISARRSRMNGLDAPTQLNISMGVKVEMEQALRQLEEVVLSNVIRVESDGSITDVG